MIEIQSTNLLPKICYRSKIITHRKLIRALMMNSIKKITKSTYNLFKLANFFVAHATYQRLCHLRVICGILHVYHATVNFILKSINFRSPAQKQIRIKNVYLKQIIDASLLQNFIYFWLL